jgi:hypothetical protein
MLVPGGQSKRVIMQSAAVATGDGTAIDCSDISIGAMATFTAQVTGITTATITWEGTIDGTNWASVQAIPLATGTAATTATANGIYRFSCLGLASVRARISAWTSGTITVTGVVCANS